MSDFVTRGESLGAESRGPTIHSVVMDERTTDLFQMLDRDVRGRLDASGTDEDEAFVRAWLGERERPGFALRVGAPWVDWEAWARGIREGWITEEGFWNGDTR